MIFDGWMPPVNYGSGSAVVVRIGVVLQLDGALVCGHNRVTESHMCVRVAMCTGGDNNGPPFGGLLCSLILVFVDGKIMMASNALLVHRTYYYV
jgi:hypothetical protein